MSKNNNKKQINKTKKKQTNLNNYIKSNYKMYNERYS